MPEKRYYWLKLKEEFFTEPDIKLLKSMPNGKDYVILYLQLQLLSLRSEGILRYKDIIPYTVDMLSTLTDSNVDIVRSAIKVFEKLQLLEIWDDGTIYLSEMQKLIGTESESAERVRRHREQKLALLQCNEQVTKCNTERELEKELDIDKEIEIEKDVRKTTTEPPVAGCPHAEIMDLYNSICTSLPKIVEITEQRRKALKTFWKQHPEIEFFKQFFERVQGSDFLTGRAKEWVASFDWIIKSSNRQKILEGNYDNKGIKNNKSGLPVNMTNFKQREYDNDFYDSLYENG